MFTKLILAFALVGSTFATLDVNRQPSVQLQEMETGFDGTPISHAGGVVINGVSQANNMTMPCNNKFCEMLKYLTTCKSLNLGMKKICAVHLLGYKYGCDVFPPAAEVVNAPSICIPSALKILNPIQKNPAAALTGILKPYLNTTNFEADNCDRHCFQNFQYATHDFYSTCRPQLSAKVPMASIMSAFQEYRNQACSTNPQGKNCYVSLLGVVSPPSATRTAHSAVLHEEDEELAPEDELAKILREGKVMDLSGTQAVVDALQSINSAVEASIAAIPAYDESAPVAVAVAAVEDVVQVKAEAAVAVADVVSEHDAHRALQQQASPDLFDFTCAYTPSGKPAAGVLAGVCSKLGSLGCCAATGLTMVQQNPISSIGALAAGGAADPTIFPPCLYRYLEDACPAVDLTNYCTNGSIASNTVIRGTIFSPLPPPNLQNVYTKTGTLQLQGIIQKALVGINPSLAAWPYLFTNPLQIQIVDYTYYSDSAGTVPLTPSNGLAYTTPGGDYTAALSGNFTYQIVNQDLDTTTAATLAAVLRSPQFQGLVSKIMTGYPTTAGNPNLVKTKTSMNPEIFAPTPFVFTNGAGSLAAHRGVQGLATVLLTLGASLLLMKPFGASA